MRRRLVPLVAAALWSAAPLAAQVPRPAALDSLRRARAAADSAGADSTRAAAAGTAARPDSTRAAADSLDPDTIRAGLPLIGAPHGPLPPSQRRVFTRDHLDWLGARSLGELLSFVPGAFLVRPGWYGHPEFIGYAGQGAAGIELFLDGYQLVALGDDSTATDLARFDIGLMHRIEVEVLPTVLRVFLVSDVATVTRPRTEASFATGDAETNTYRGRYLNRWKNGAGLGIAASYFATNGPPTSPADINSLSIWVKGTWTPSPLVGVEYSMMSAGLERNAAAGDGTSQPLAGINATRRDAFVRAHAATRPDGMGLRFDALFGSSSFSDTTGTIDVQESQAGASAGYRADTWALETTARFRSGREPLTWQARAAWAPWRAATLSAWTITRRRLGDERDLEAGAAGDLRLLRGISVHGAVRWRDLVTDTTQRVGDWQVGVRLRRGASELDVTTERHGAFRAPTFGTFAAQVPRATTIDVVTLTAAWDLRPWTWLTFHGWYRHPLDPIHAAYEPPHHTRAALTFRSRFFPHYRRGVFDLMVQAELEGWGDGVVGTSSLGVPIALEGATVVHYLLEVRLVGAILFWTFRNPQLEQYAILPGFPMPRGLQRFGVRWEFTN